MRRHRIILAALTVALIGASLEAATVRKMSLGEMSDRAGRIFRGTVVSISPGAVPGGGGTLATVDYLIEVTEAFKGEFQSKGDKRYALVRMFAKPKQTERDGIRRFSNLPDLPQLSVGGDYLLLATTASRIGLSTTVGLGQGCFSVAAHGKQQQEMAVNELGNLGLYEGPVTYDTLANDIRAALGQ